MLHQLLESRSDSWLRSYALRALGEIGAADDRSLAALIEATRKNDPDESLRAVVGLGLLGPAASDAVDAVCACLNHEEPFVATAVPHTLAQIAVRTPEVGDALARAVAGETDPDRYLPLLEAIGKLKAPSDAARAALDEARSSEDPTRGAGGILAGYLVDGDVAPVRRVMADPDVLWVMSEWRVPLEALREDLVALVANRAELSDEAMPYLIGHLIRAGAVDECAPVLEAIVADETADEWTRDMARVALNDAPGSAAG